MTEHKLAHILRAIADGKTVQIKCNTFSSHHRRTVFGEWQDVNTQDAFSIFVTDPNTEYRIKPKPLVKKWRWVYEERDDGNLDICSRYFNSAEEFDKQYPGAKAIQRIDSTMIEVEED